MSKLVLITALCLFPFVIPSALAQFELPTYELPHEHIVTYEQESPDSHEVMESRRKTMKILLIVAAIYLLLIIVIGVIAATQMDDIVENVFESMEQN